MHRDIRYGADAERAIEIRRQRVVDALRPFLGPMPDPDEIARAREEALVRALTLRDERREGVAHDFTRGLDAALLPVSPQDVYAELLDAYRVARQLREAALGLVETLQAQAQSETAARRNLRSTPVSSLAVHSTCVRRGSQEEAPRRPRRAATRGVPPGERHARSTRRKR